MTILTLIWSWISRLLRAKVVKLQNFGVHRFVCVSCLMLSDCTDGRFGVHCFVCVFCLMVSDCTDGRFGVHCQSRCNCKDTSEVCDSVSGKCQSGCRMNYAGGGCLLGKLHCNSLSLLSGLPPSHFPYLPSCTVSFG